MGPFFPCPPLEKPREISRSARNDNQDEASAEADGKFVSGLVEMILYFVPERGVAQAFFDGVGDGNFGAVDFQAVSHVVENGLGERIGALEDHANAAAKSGNVLREDALAVEKDF